MLKLVRISIGFHYAEEGASKTVCGREYLPLLSSQKPREASCRTCLRIVNESETYRS